MISKHSCGDSKLTCIDCSAVICGKCMVQCPVGFRCGSCGKISNPLTAVTPFLVAKTLGLCALIGFGFGHAMQFIDLPWIGVIICYFVGLVTGRFLTRFIDYKMGRNIGTTIVFGLLIGMSLSPLRFLPMAWGMCLQNSGAEPFSGMFCVVCSLFSPVGFVVGVLRPTVWGDRF